MLLHKCTKVTEFIQSLSVILEKTICAILVTTRVMILLDALQ